MPAAPPLNPGDEPRHYRISKGQRVGIWFGIAYAALTCMFFGGMAFFAYTSPWSWVIAAGCLGVLWMVVVSSRQIFRRRISLYPDRLEYDSGRKVTIVERSEIAGGRLTGSGVTLFRKADLKELVTFSLDVQKDDAFWPWFDAFRDLDEEEARAGAAELLADSKLGSTEEERLASSVRQIRALTWFKRASWLMAAWAMLYPRPYLAALVMSALIPAVGLWLLFKWPVAQVLSRGFSPKVPLTSALVLPSLALGVRAVLDTCPVNWLDLALPVLLVTLAIGYALHRAQNGLKWRAFLVMTLLLASYPASTISLLNEILDRSAPTEEVVTVVGKHASRRVPFLYFLELSPGGAWATSHEKRVSPSTYETVRVGETPCLLTYRGALGIRHWALREVCGYE